jgi:AraC family transcriptional regulator
MHTDLSSQITFGKKLKSVSVHGFVITDTIHSPSFTLERHSHERPNIACVLKGSFTETFDSHTQECSLHSVLIKPAGEAHSNKYGRVGAHCLIIEVETPRLDTLLSATRIFDRTGYLQGATFSTHVMRIHKELRSTDSVSVLAIEGLVLEMLADLTRRSCEGLPATPRWLREAKDYIHEYFMQKVSLVNLAEIVQVHPSHLARMFRQYYHLSVGDYVRKLRLEYAAGELAESQNSLVEIATTVGFYDQSHFTNSFKLYMGRTPSEFRKATQERNPRTKGPQSSKTL